MRRKDGGGRDIGTWKAGKENEGVGGGPRGGSRRGSAVEGRMERCLGLMYTKSC